MYGHEATIRHLQSWCRDNYEQGSPGRAVLNEALQRHFLTKLEEQAAPHSNAGLFGMSSAGGCLRAQALRRASVKGTPAPGDDQVTWELGHLGEVLALATLEAAGFHLAHVQAPAVIPGVFSSTADAVLADGPVDLPYPLILSAKTASYKMGGAKKRRGFAALPLEGIANENGTWSVQAQLEMQALGMEHVLFLVLAKDMVKQYEGDPLLPSLSWYAELLPRVPGSVAHIVEAHKLVLDGDGAPVIPRVPPLTFWPNGNGFKAIRLPEPGSRGTEKSGWGGPNQEATGRFNVCFSCAFSALCRGEARP